MNTTCLKHGRVNVASAAEHRRQGEKQSARANERKRERDLMRSEMWNTYSGGRGGFDTVFLYAGSILILQRDVKLLIQA